MKKTTANRPLELAVVELTPEEAERAAGGFSFTASTFKVTSLTSLYVNPDGTGGEPRPNTLNTSALAFNINAVMPG